MRKRILVLTVAAVVTVAMLYPIETTVVPEWNVQTIDESGRPVGQVRLRQSWENYRIKPESYEQYIVTDVNGYATFPSRAIRANLLLRIIRTVSTFNLHGSPGLVATIHVLPPYASATPEPYYKPGGQLVQKIIVKRLM